MQNKKNSIYYTSWWRKKIRLIIFWIAQIIQIVKSIWSKHSQFGSSLGQNIASKVFSLNCLFSRMILDSIHWELK